MQIISRYLRKNIFSKPLRTFLLVFCIVCCSFVAVLSMDTVGNLDSILKMLIMQSSGTSDFVVNDTVGVEKEFELSFENDQLLVFSASGAVIERNSEFYSYYHKNEYKIQTMDYDKALKMRLMPIKPELASGEAAISAKLSENTGWKIGDDITLYDNRNREQSFKITSIVQNAGVANGQRSVFINNDDFFSLGNSKRAKTVYVDILDDKNTENIKTACTEVENADLNAQTVIFLESEEYKDIISSLKLIFLMIFSICFLLVIFVAVSISNRIVGERFSVVGTFRSLGISSSFCTGLLLAENALYGVIGSIIGIILYSLIRENIFNSIVQIDAVDFDLNFDFPMISPVSVITVLLLGTSVMCVCPLKEIIRTSKTAIRDIIFDNKDTAYKMSRMAEIIGAVCAVSAIVLLFIKGNSFLQIVCFVLIISALALLFPRILKVSSVLLQKLFEKTNMPIARMAASECRSRKSTVGSSVMCVTASALAMIIFIFISTLGSIYDIDTYDCDIIVKAGKMQEYSRFSYIKDLEGVTDTEVVYCTESKIGINDKKTDVMVFGANEGGFELLTAIKGLPETIADDEIVMDRSFAKKMKLEKGDKAEITFGTDTYLPITKTFKISELVNASDYDSTGNAVVLSENMYKNIYHNYPGEILVRCTDTERTLAQIKKYSAVTAEDVFTSDEWLDSWREKEDGLRNIMTAVMIVGVGLTVTGMISNLLIGFQGRKRECAVLASTSMTRGNICKMFVLESMTAAGISLTAALPTAFIAFQPIKSLIENMEEIVNIAYDVKMYVLFLAVLWAVFTLCSLFPIKELRKMNLASQLKYE